ncbi:MAG: sugar transferase [Allosphingosinicella sp.]|uniref:sugar transferase n=1 Tax=Allosphingosinicella sp. TaxID=2823234 RepID=UPI00395587AF
MAKRLLDIVVAGLALVIGAPFLLIIALVVLATMGRPVLFRQQRPGLHGRPFQLLKFRTMLSDAKLGTDVASDARRLTRTGRFLRATSLDELPELWNVLRGDMSLVGPRPLLMQYLGRYTPEQARRHDVRPGLTGWAQVNGRNALSWEEKFALDTWYVDNRSFWLDLKIILMTAASLVRPHGISAEGSATMPEFMGSTPQANPPEPARRFP